MCKVDITEYETIHIYLKPTSQIARIDLVFSNYRPCERKYANQLSFVRVVRITELFSVFSPLSEARGQQLHLLHKTVQGLRPQVEPKGTIVGVSPCCI